MINSIIFFIRDRHENGDLYTDYEDIPPRSAAGASDVAIETNSESSDYVELIEELSTFPTREELNEPTLDSKGRASKRARTSAPATTSRGHKSTPRPLNQNLSIFNYFDKDCIPVNDLIDFVAIVGGNIVSSNKPMQPPQLFSKNRALTNVYNLSQKRKRGARQQPESVVDDYIKKAIQCSQTVFERLRTQANKITKGRSADFIPKNPFLYPWEHDKDRMNGGQWRERREQFLSLTKPTEDEEGDGEEIISDSENNPPAVRPGKRKLRATQRNLPGEVDTARRSAVAEVQPILLGYRWPEGRQSNSSPEKSISEGDEYVWMIDPTTHKRYQVLKSSYERDKAFVVGESTLSNRFTPQYLDNLANQCDAVTGPPGIFEFLNHTYLAVVEFCFHPDIYTYSSDIYFRVLETVEWEPYFIATLIAIAFTIARYLCAFFFFRTAVGKKFITEQSQKKAMTPLWSAISYAFLFSVEAFTLYNYGYNDFIYPLCIFKEIHYTHGYFDVPVPAQYFWLYMLQIGYYMHSFYATIRLDIRRKDTTVILVHHVLTIALLSFSFFAR
ncbi:unnamed protein product [Rodentolepis nana]|uniref:TLC domain-containing protein n=1 Tax=Rodentolepis nana TaxID=102285 RepID=A0A3P7WDG1_RODNA|nr:unnamed protein product [Rodentolepis nana]